MPLMVPILSILCPKQPLRVVDPAFLVPGLCLLGAGWSLWGRAHIPMARVSMRKSRINRIRERTASIRLSLSSDCRNSASSSPSKFLRDWNKVEKKRLTGSSWGKKTHCWKETCVLNKREACYSRAGGCVVLNCVYCIYIFKTTWTN